MGYGRLSDPTVSDWFDQLAAMDLHGALFGADPFTSDPLLAELAGGGYVRIGYSIDRLAFNLLRNLNAMMFLGLPAGTNIVAVGAFDADINGTFRFGALLDTPYALPSGGTYTIGAGMLPVGVDVAVGP